ncbi:MAG TPA: hypothetical protein VFK92_11745 [Burkholderiales bacterium]|nr:hypothetical protein [Burkholderiales bacterium]
MGAALVLACALPAQAAETRPPQESRSLLWAGFDVGYASVARSYSVTSDTRDGKFTFALRGGIQIDPRLLVGVEFGGWTLQSGNNQDPATGEAIGTRFLVVQVYPLAHSAFFVRGGGGRVVYSNNRPGESGASGTGGIVGIGYDFGVKRRDGEHTAFYITPSLDYSAGSYSGATSPPGVVQDQRYRALSARIGLTFR